MTSILDLARLAATKPGIDPPSPRWSAVLAYAFGLPLTETDVDELVTATKRSRESIIEHARQTIGRRRFRQLWARVGRRGRKSSTAALIAVYEALHGGHEKHIIPGERALAAVISKDLAGGAVVGTFARTYLDALGIKYTTTKIGAVSLIEIEGCPIAIATLAATSEAPRGFAICCLILDEIAHFATGEEYIDTDRTIIRGAAAAMLQFPDALTIGISTGLGRDGVHYERVERGLGNDGERDILSVTGASWEWSTDIDRVEAERIADGDAEVMLTEFEGGVSENEALWMPQADAQAMFLLREAYYLWSRQFMIVDMAEGGGDVAAWGRGAFGDPDPKVRYKPLFGPPGSGCEFLTIGIERDEHGIPRQLPIADRPVFRLFDVGGFDAAEIRELRMEGLVERLADIAIKNGITQIIGDDRGGPYLEAMFRKYANQGLRFNYVTYANKKHEAVLMLRGWARDHQIWLPEHRELRRQCLRYRRILRGATYTYGKPNERDDFVSLLVTLGVTLVRRAEERSSDFVHIQGAPTDRHLGGRHMTMR